MANRNLLRKLVATGLLLLGAAAQAADKPNILVIWGDDIGTWNISHNSRGMMGYQTPSIDRIAKEGLSFTDYYGQQSCTAGRVVQCDPGLLERRPRHVKRHPSGPRRQAVVELAALRQCHDSGIAHLRAVEVADVDVGGNESQHHAVGRHAAAREQRQVVGAVVEHGAGEIGMNELADEASTRELDVIDGSTSYCGVERLRRERVER